VSAKDAAALQDHAGWGDVSLDVLVEALFSRQPEVVLKDLLAERARRSSAIDSDEAGGRRTQQ
jgi:hypothetical protein